MYSFRISFLIACIVLLSGCSGGGPSGNLGSSSSPSSSVITPASQVETAKLQEAIKADPTYKIDDSEIALLQAEGVITEADKAQLQAIQ